nr:mitochondrial protein cyt-4 [Quercus suber]
MLSTCTRSLPSTSASSSWICLSCRARSRHNSGLKHNKTQEQHGIDEFRKSGEGKSPARKSARLPVQKSRAYDLAEFGRLYGNLSTTSGTQAQALAWRPSHRLASQRKVRSSRMYSTLSTAEDAQTFQNLPPLVEARPQRAIGEPNVSIDTHSGIRDKLRQWQALNANQMAEEEIEPQQIVGQDGMFNMFTRLPPEKATPDITSEGDEHEALAHFMQNSAEDAGDDIRTTQHLVMGDLVEIESPSDDQASIVAVFIRKLGIGHKFGGDLSQFFTMQGRWIHSRDKSIMYSVPHFLPKDKIERLLPYLPTQEDAEDLDALMKEDKLTDLSVPRNLSAPIVRELLAFHTEAKEIYRRHARRLDEAHQLLAHDTDLRYGSLVTAACTLLKTTPDMLTQPALFAVRQALMHAGFAFNVDRRSHRRTGYLQIRSKEQVRMVEDVRNWMRAWQDDRSLTATMDEVKLKRHTPPRGAQYVYKFLRQARQIVLENRKTRQPTICGNVSPSNQKITATSTNNDCVQVSLTTEFGYEEGQIIKFMEVWALTQQLKGHARLASLPPLLLQATGLYDPEWSLVQSVGFQFLQELGSIMPYENRVRSDQHLLLPSSQHSKPLQSLMSTLMDMQSKPDFFDSMQGLRKDWKDTPVYCIDSASALEIDDGISIQKAEKDLDGHDTYWVNVHIANPTAFFSRDHPLAKMARHMGESIYMPERTYMMLPRWTTQKYFSLANGRPCLTFSARLDHKGHTIEHKIESGLLRNVIRLTVDEVDNFLGGDVANAQARDIFLTVGGNPPTPKTRTSSISSLTVEQKQQLHTLHYLAEQRTAVRRGAGGLFFDTQNFDVSVWQNLKNEGLAWDHPYRRGRRTVHGDPGIQVRCKPFTNPFAPTNMAANTTVRESMLLACEVAANWCAERNIPGVFRGSLYRPDEEDDQARFVQEKLEPLWRSGKYPEGEYPMHLGMQYLRTFGETHLSTRPFKHRVLGMDAYGKVTSPLRRYGDMILHWQIEAALREEARRGHSLITQDPNEPRPFLPFSAAVLDTIHVGLQPREMLILKAKLGAQLHWASLLFMRALHFNETVLPFEKPGYTKVYLHATNMFLKSNWFAAPATSTELNIPINITPTLDGVKQGPFRQGDVWEVKLKEVDVWQRTIMAEPVRLLERVD